MFRRGIIFDFSYKTSTGWETKLLDDGINLMSFIFSTELTVMF
jgi:hypothetical protein